MAFSDRPHGEPGGMTPAEWDAYTQLVRYYHLSEAPPGSVTAAGGRKPAPMSSVEWAALDAFLNHRRLPTRTVEERRVAAALLRWWYAEDCCG